MLTIAIAVLLIVANGSPLFLAKLLGSRADWPVDRGQVFKDGKPLLGPSKTWRGILSALLLTSLAAAFMGLDLMVGFSVGAGAMAGDLISSFIKRRLGLASSAKAIGLDQLPESLLPAILLHVLFDYGWIELIGAVALFALVDVSLSPLLFKLGLRRVPH